MDRASCHVMKGKGGEGKCEIGKSRKNSSNGAARRVGEDWTKGKTVRACRIENAPLKHFISHRQ